MKHRMTRILLSLGAALALLVGSAWAYWTERLEAELTLPLNQPFTLWVEGLTVQTEEEFVGEAAAAERGADGETVTEREANGGESDHADGKLPEQEQLPPAEEAPQRAEGAETPSTSQSVEAPAPAGDAQE